MMALPAECPPGCSASGGWFVFEGLFSALSHNLGELARQSLRIQPHRGEDPVAFGVLQEALLDPEGAHGNVEVSVAQETRHRVADRAHPAVVFHHGDHAVPGRPPIPVPGPKA